MQKSHVLVEACRNFARIPLLQGLKLFAWYVTELWTQNRFLSAELWTNFCRNLRVKGAASIAVICSLLLVPNSRELWGIETMFDTMWSGALLLSACYGVLIWCQFPTARQPASSNLTRTTTLLPPVGNRLFVVLTHNYERICSSF